MAPLPAMDCVLLDQERKKELVMEKKLRACRVNIIPRERGYCLEPNIPPPVVKPRTPPPSPSAIERARNPVALRYWSQCRDQSVERVHQYGKDQRSASENRRENEIKEAVGNIHRFVTIDKIRKEDTERNSRSRFRQGKAMVDIQDSNSKSYNSIKAEQIQISQGRSDFQNKTANRIPNSPKPYRRGVSETRIQRQEKTCDCMNTRDMNVNHMNNEVIPAMNVNEKTKLCLAIIEQLPSDVKCALLAHQLSTLSHTTLSAVMNSLPDEVISTAMPTLFPRTKDDVKLSLILDSVPKLTKQLRN